MRKLYYIENRERGCVGNSVLWWAFNDNGYTCDIKAAKKFDEDEALELVRPDKKFMMHRVEHIDQLVQHHIDIQDLRAGRKEPHTLSYLQKKS